MNQPPATSIDKSTWGPGPWQGEPDHKQWQDPATGLPCLAHRHESNGHWCGYVAVPPGHPAHGRQYDSLDVQVHGGLTYGAPCDGQICHTPAPGEPDNVHWFGFDCAHYQDLSPGMDARDREHGWVRSGGIYRTLHYVEGECASLAQQLAALQLPDSSQEVEP